MTTLARALAAFAGLYVAPWLLIGCGLGGLLARQRGASARRGAVYGLGGPPGWLLLWQATELRAPRRPPRRWDDERWDRR